MNKTLLLFVICCISFIQAQNLLDVYKNVTAISGSSNYEVHIGYKLKSKNEKVTDVQIQDTLPSNVELTKGQLNIKADDPTSDWTFYSYEVAVKVDPYEFSLVNRTSYVYLPGAQVSYAKDKSSKDRETVSTNEASIDVDISSLIPKGGWLLPELYSSVVVGFFTLIFPILAAINLIDIGRNNAVKAKKQK